MSAVFRKTGFALTGILVSLTLSCSSSQEKQTEPATPVDKSLQAVDGEEIIPQKYRSIYIQNFRNRNYESDLIGRLKEKLQLQFQQNGRLKVELNKDKADVILYGSLESFREVPATFDRFGQPSTYSLFSIVEVTLRVHQKHLEKDNPNANSIIMEKRIVRFDTTYSPRQPPFESRFTAIERLLDGLSQRTVHTVFNGWYSELKTKEELGYDQDRRRYEDEEVVIPRDMSKEHREKLKEKYYVDEEKDAPGID